VSQLRLLWRRGERPNVHEFLARAGNLSPAQIAAVLRVDQEERWRRSERVPAESYFQHYPELRSDTLTGSELVYSEFQLRSQLGESPSVEEYLSRFPEMGTDLKRHMEEHPVGENTMVGPPTIAGHDVLGVLGRGGMGVVYKARQKNLNRIVALKMVLAGAHADPKELARFRREAEAVAHLQHPNIVQIYEVGEHGGLPFFSLEYVDGGGLDKALAGKPQPVRPAAALVQTLAGAVHYAHEQGIVHRDLKPANILLTSAPRAATGGTTTHLLGRNDNPLAAAEYGQPKVTDFGLAKRLDTEGTLSPTGAIVGTPSYMAPEQAAAGRRPIRPAVDIYALGAILYEMLTGRPPFQAETPMDTLMQVVAEEPVPPSRLRPKLPRDLETICLKCLQKQPHKRYATALALGDDLGRFLAGQPIVARPVGRLGRAWRWCRRNPVVSSLLTALAVVLTAGFVAVMVQWQRAEDNLDEANRQRALAESSLEEANAQKARAESAFRQARRAVDDYFTRVSENKLLGVPHLEPLRKELLESALKYYQDFLQQAGDDPKVQTDMATAHFRVATITELISTKDKAHASYAEALRLYEKLLKDDPGNILVRKRLTVCCSDFALSRMESGGNEEAGRYLRRAREVGEALVRDKPTEPEYQAALAKVYLNTALLNYKSGRTDEAARFYRRCQDMQEKIVRDRPSWSEYQADLALTVMNEGSLYLETGRPDEALVYYNKALAMQEKLVKQHPDAIYYRRLMGAIHHNLGMLHRLASRPAETLAHYQQARQIREKLARDHPTVNDYRNDIGETLNNIGEFQLANRETDTAFATLKEAGDIFQKLADSHAANTKYKNARALALNNVGVVLQNTEKSAEAIKQHQEALKLRRELVRDEPDVTDYQSHLADSHSNLANSLRTLDRPAEAMRAYRESIALYSQLVARNPATTKYRVNLGLGYTNLGYLLEAEEEYADALEAIEQARVIRQELVNINPRIPRYQADLAQSYFYLGKVQAQLSLLRMKAQVGGVVASLGRGPLAYLPYRLLKPDKTDRVPQEAALKSYDQAMAIQEKLVKDHPNSFIDYRADLARTYIQIGNAIRDEKKLLDAFGWYKKAVDEWKKVLAEKPWVPEFQSNLAVSHYNFGITLQDLRLALAALSAHQQGLALRDQLVREHSDDKVYRRQYGESQNSVGIAQLSLRRRLDALNSFNEARDQWEFLTLKYPDNARYRSDLGRAYLNLAITLDEMGRREEAEMMLVRLAMPHQRQAIRGAPTQSRYRHLLGKCYVRLAKVQRGQGRLAEALAAALEARKLAPDSGEDLVKIAGELALCSAEVGKDKKAELTAEERAERDRYAGESVRTLRLLVNAGMPEALGLENKAELDSLRERQDFKEVLAQAAKIVKN
jgi:tetratricopeptide (TPR) repeat protein